MGKQAASQKISSALRQRRAGAAKAHATSTCVPTHEAIARRAFELYLSRGAEHGHDMNDWLRAEQELCQPA